MKLIKQLKLASAITTVFLIINSTAATLAADTVISTDTTINAGTTISLTGTDTLTINSGVTYTFNQTSFLEGINVNTGATGVVITNNGKIVQNNSSAINLHDNGILHFINNGTLINNSLTYNYAMQTLAGGNGVFTLTNNGVILGTPSGSTQSFLFFLGNAAGSNNIINLNKGSIVSGLFASNKNFNLNMNVGASKTYNYKTDHDYYSGNAILSELNNRPSMSSINYVSAVNIGSMEVAGENLYQKTANITDAVDRNVKNNKDTWVEPYYSESTRDSGGDSSQIRQFKNNKQGINAGFKVANSAKPLQVIFNVDQTKNNIDNLEHVINGDSVMIGLTAPSYANYEGFDVSVKGLVGYANSKTDRKILDNTTTTGERILTGEYDSYYAVVGSALSKNYNLDKDLNANLTLGVDLTSEFRDSYSENLYFKYNSINLVQLQPKIQSEFVKTTGKDSNVFLTAGVGAREILSGKTQKYSMNNTGVSFTTPNSGDYYASLAVGTNMNVAANINFYTLVSTKMSDRDTETYQASIGLKGTF